MNESELINEVLELTLACQQGRATPEEHARLERLLADNPHAILWYLRIVDDTLTLLDAAAARETAASATPAMLNTTKPGVVSPVERRSSTFSFAGRRQRLQLAFAAAASILIAGVFTALLLSPSKVTDQQAADTFNDSARILEVSNVVWADGAKDYAEWSLLRPGETLQFKSGWINLFLSNGAELLIEGPADVRFDSSKKVFARQGKLAARIGPGAIGFCIETPHANVIDRGTEFGLSVDKNKRTSVVVYKGAVDLDVVGDTAQPRHRLATGEALRVDRAGQLSRITTVASNEFLEPPQLRFSASQKGLITSISDNIRSLKTTKYYRVIPHGFCEDCQAYVDRLHEWNGVDGRGLPPFLVGGDYVMTFNDDKIAKDLSIAVTVSQPANVYLLIDDRVPPADWLKRDFVDTGWDVGADEGYLDRDIHTAKGTGQSIEHVYSVWRRRVTHPDTIVLGALGAELFTKPARDVERSMYGIVVTPLRGERAN
jgi:FecR protein